MNRSSIEWTDYTWNPVTGCKHGCIYCYARRLAEGRLKGRFGYDNGFEPTLHRNRLVEPYNVRKPSRIFVSSMGDLMGEWVPTNWIQLLMPTIWNNPQHTFQLLTKNPRRYSDFKWPPNVWFGTSIDGNGSSIDRLQELREVELNWGDAIRYVSFEPLLADIASQPEFDLEGIDWIIIGSQTGPQARQPDKLWYARIIRRAVRHRIPLFIKDNLEWPDGWTFERPQNFPRILHNNGVGSRAREHPTYQELHFDTDKNSNAHKKFVPKHSNPKKKPESHTKGEGESNE